jgi:hypothetical protein
LVAIVTLEAVIVILLVVDGPSAVALDQLGKVACLLGPPDEWMLEHLLGGRPLLGVALQAELHKLLEGPREIAFQPRRGVFRDQEKHLHGVNVGIRRLAVGKLQRCDAQRPNVSLVIVAALLDHLGRHPERCPHEGVLLGHGGR